MAWKKKGGRSSTQKGTRFENRVRRAFEEKGCAVFRLPREPRCDLIVLAPIKNINVYGVRLTGEKTDIKIQPSVPLVIECKTRKYLNPEERQQLKDLKPFANVYVAYPEGREDHKGRTNIVLADPETKEVKMIIRDQM